MNKNLLLLGGLIVAGAIGAFLFLKKPTLPGTPSSGTQTMSASMAQLLGMGKDYMCTFDTTDEAGLHTTGTVYVAAQGRKMHGDFMMTQADGTQMQTFVMSDGEYSYIWSAAQAQGMKMKLDPEDDQLIPQSQGEAEQAALDQDQPVDFNCQPWRPDNSKFVPPSNVEFTDFSAQMEMMQKQTEMMQEDSGANCAVCDQMPAGEARTQCLASLGC
ncbi:MAG: hypothetical protein UY13_C0002G0095 [Candidatus Pacebacteria bacterium GW2011_GWB1_47_8]|nr:MAG: hypothetical protein UX28_C0001G0243 [Candidatus Pacebacteria bacterium GW2011_GWA1_46_10]KKU84183.1 MAG: hypothetical protein UY13_C0002G0095 [Candidatus Pacebacteria bacterium GW2011_GWB1_47_8]HCR81070.1 hypothetical protein [Candidatus Paceibacterota bacterium]